MAYDALAVLLFVSGYFAMMELEDSIKPLMACHLQELMADTELYGWEPVR